MKSLFITLIIVAIIPTSYSQQQKRTAVPETARDKKAYLGMRYAGNKLPAGHKWMAGSLLSDPYKDEKQYGVTHVVRGRVNMMWFDLLTHNDAEGHPHWIIKDVLFLPPISKNQQLFHVDCSLNDKPDPELVVIVDNVVRAGYYTQVRHAWRANRRTEKIEPIPTKGIKCVGWGDG